MKLRTNEILYTYWDRIRQDRPAPRRFDIDPTQISQILDEALILELADGDGFRFRIAGTQTCEIFGRELRGVDLLSLWSNDADRIALQCSVQRVVRQCGCARIEFEGCDADGRTAAFEMLLLPLFHTGEHIDRCIGAISELPNGRSPACRPIFEPRLVSEEVIWPGNEPSPRVPFPLGSAAQMPDRHAEARLVRTKNRDFLVYDGGLEKRHR